MSPTTAIIIGNATVRQHDGLYSLNDLHAASGGKPSQRPGEWIRNDQTKALIEEISKAEIPALEARRGGSQGSGTYACRELVIAYAAWISPAFHLRVIRAFLDGAAPAAAARPDLQRAYNQRAHALAIAFEAATLNAIRADAPATPEAVANWQPVSTAHPLLTREQLSLLDRKTARTAAQITSAITALAQAAQDNQDARRIINAAAQICHVERDAICARIAG